MNRERRNVIEVPEQEIELSFSRSSGPGGQGVNKVNSRVRLRWNPSESSALNSAQKARFCARYRNRITEKGEMIITSDVHRDQKQNLAECHARLAEMIQAIAIAPKRRVPTKPTRANKRERREAKGIRSEHKRGRRKPSWEE